MAKKPLRYITPKGDTKLVSDKLKGVNKSETKPMDLDDFLMDPDNMKGSKDFVKKHQIQKHADRVGNTEAPYTSSKAQAKYARADGKMYEAADCSCEHDKDSCSVHGKGKKLLLGGKKQMKEHAEFSGLEAMPGAAPSGMVKNAENTWKNAEQYFDKPPTQLTGQGKPFLPKMSEMVKESIREIQKEAVDNLHEKLTDDAKGKIRTALSDKMKKTSGPARALIKLAKKNPANIKEEDDIEEELKGNQKKLDKNHNGRLDKEDFKILRKEETVEEGIRPLNRKDTAYKDNPRKLSNEYPKSFRQPGTPSKESLRDLANAGMKEFIKKGGKIRKEETDIEEEAPPSKSSEEWIKKNKARFTKEYGKDKGERVLYGKAWNDYKAKHEETQTDYTNAKNGQTKPQLPSGRNLDTGNL